MHILKAMMPSILVNMFMAFGMNTTFNHCSNICVSKISPSNNVECLLKSCLASLIGRNSLSPPPPWCHLQISSLFIPPETLVNEAVLSQHMINVFVHSIIFSPHNYVCIYIYIYIYILHLIHMCNL